MDVTLNEKERRLIKVYAECSMNASEAGRKSLYTGHWFSVMLDNIYDRTGLNPKNFFDLVKLYRMAGGVL